MERKNLLRLVTAVALAMGTTTGAMAQKGNPPTMGWSSWNTFALNINEQLIRSQAEAMVSTGLADAGYRYVNIDDGYWDGRGEDGHLRLNTKLFPSGMRALTDYVHSLGLKAGIYSDAGDNTCGSAGGSQAWGRGVGLAGHEEQDCRLYFDDWNFDFIKVDYCGGMGMRLDEREQYTKVANAIKGCRKQGVAFNICRWAYPGTWVGEVADSWRTTGDIYCDWRSVRSIIRENLYIQAYTGGGHYNDADMLEIGRTLSPDEEITHMVYWCITSSPLLIGCDLTKIPQRSLDLLKNRDLLAMNQDGLGLGAPVVQREDKVYVVAKDMKQRMGPLRAVAVMNLSDEERTVGVSVEAMGFEGKVSVYDCLTHTQLPKAEGTIEVTIPAHGSQAYFVSGLRSERCLYQAEEAYLNAYQELGRPNTAAGYAAKAADQGEYIGYLGHGEDNWLEWRDVHSRKGGRYTLRIRYASKEPRAMYVSVNGELVAVLTTLSSGDWTDRWATVDVPVTLKKGFNSVRLSNPYTWMPNIDCMTVVKQ